MSPKSLLITAAVAAFALAGFSAADAAQFPFQPITVKRINLPSNVKEATRPLFTTDGKHLLFWFDDELWITTLTGRGTKCLSCGVANSPRSPGEDLATPFADGKRVFFGGYVQPGAAQMAVLECSPSVMNCKSKKILPVDFSAAEPATIPPGGAVSVAQTNLLGASSAKLSPDNKHVGFSDLRSDSALNMVVGKLARTSDRYVVTDPKVINPPAPTSASDTNAASWSDSSALFEFKTFTHGGADATYVQVGGINKSPDVWQVNLKTGERTRLTAHPDYDEDVAESPDGKLLAMWSNRTEHFTDWIGGLLPVRDFISAPMAVMSAQAIGANKMCHGPMWLLPSTGDQNGNLAGQPVLSYAYPNVTVTNNLTGNPQWSPNGTMLALNTNLTTQPYDPPRGKNAPFLLVAHLTARRAAKAQSTRSSDVGSWAPAPTDYHGAMGFKGTVTLPGPGGGSVTVTYNGDGPGAFFGGDWTETYNGYSDDGKSFVNGTVAIHGLLEGTYTADLTMTGAHTGSQDARLVFKKLSVSGTATSTLDGHTISGPPQDMVDGGACPTILPKKPALHAKVTSLGGGKHRVLVTASVADMGLNESQVDTQPVEHATVKLGSHRAYTNSNGVAIVRGRGKLTVSAGNTLKPLR